MRAISEEVLDDALIGFSTMITCIVLNLDRERLISRITYAACLRECIERMKKEDPDNPAGDMRTAFQVLRLTADLCDAGQWPSETLVPRDHDGKTH